VSDPTIDPTGAKIDPTELARNLGVLQSARLARVRAPCVFPELRHLRGPWVVCWYPRVLPRDLEDVQPLVKVTVRDVHETDVNRAFARPPVPLTALGQLRIGTVLEDGCSTHQVSLPLKRLRVVFDAACTTHQLRPLYRRLRQRPDWFVGVGLGGTALRLPLHGRGDLWIPSLEYFSRCYGRSQEVKRILLECPWEQALERLFAPVPADEASSGSRWRIRYGSAASRLVPADAVFLAYVQHSLYAEARAKRLYSDLDVRQPATAAEEAPRRRKGIVLNVAPWFLGPVRLKVRGLPLADGGFLALRVDGSSAPTRPADLSIERLVASDDPSADPEDHADPGVDSDSTVRRRRRRISADGLPVVGSQAPAWNAREAQLLDTDFEELAPRRDVRTVRFDRHRGPPARVVSSPHPSRISAAEPAGSDQDTGVAVASSPSVPQTEDVPRDVWNALQFFRERYPACVRTVDWFTPASGFGSSLPLGFVRFRLDGPYSSRRAYPWVRLQPGVRRPRGFVVIRVGVSGGSGSEGTRHLYLVEIERRALEKFSGLVFDLERRDDSVEGLRAWVDVLRRKLPLRRGVFASLLGDCPGKAATYQHLSPDHDRRRQETGVRNALRKMGVPRAALQRSTR